MNPFFWLSDTHEEIMDNYDEDIIITTREGKIIKVTQLSGEHYDIPPSELLGKSVYDLEKQGIFTPAITPKVVEKKKKVVMVQQTSSESKVLITGIPLFNETGEVEYVVSYSYQLSELNIIKDYLNNLENEMSFVKEELAYLREQQLEITGFAMESPSAVRAMKTAVKLAKFDAPLVIHGERGTGKTMLAKFIHSRSKCSDGPFIEVNCGTIPEGLFRQNFIGKAHSRLPGYLSLAEKGTLVLKEIEQLSRASQALLFEMLSGTPGIRIIAISETPLELLAEQDTFREDLFYFLNLASIHLKPLRERAEDLDLAIFQCLQKLNEKYKEKKTLDDDLHLHLLQLQWPGNFRELKSILERSFLESETTAIHIEDLPANYQPDEKERIGIEIEGQTLPRIMDIVEKKVLLNAQERYKTTTQMAKMLGISQPSVVRKLQKYAQKPIEDGSE